jgi:hypothetical protein
MHVALEEKTSQGYHRSVQDLSVSLASFHFCLQFQRLLLPWPVPKRRTFSSLGPGWDIPASAIKLGFLSLQIQFQRPLLTKRYRLQHLVGEAVESCWLGNITVRKSGTSFATPIAAGAAAGILMDYLLFIRDGNWIEDITSSPTK